MKIKEILLDIEDEYQVAIRKHRTPFRSPHEAYAILKEEVDEFWDAVKEDDYVQQEKELLQVAAMALRALKDVYVG